VFLAAYLAQGSFFFSVSIIRVLIFAFLYHYNKAILPCATLCALGPSDQILLHIGSLALLRFGSLGIIYCGSSFQEFSLTLPAIQMASAQIYKIAKIFLKI